ADSILAIYSTTATVSSSAPFNGRATLRMERLVNPGSPPDTSKLFGHLFWEIWSSGSNVAGDTLRVELVRGLPYNQYQTVLTACAYRTVNIASFGLGDQTFVRNSGDFTHAFIGEGGHITTQFARVFNYSAKQPLIASPADTLNSEPVTGFPERGKFDRMVFAASPDTSILAFEPYCSNQQKAIQIRDPIVGPLRVALDTATSTQYVFAITSRGLVVVTLPGIPNINPQAPPFRRSV